MPACNRLTICPTMSRLDRSQDVGDGAKISTMIVLVLRRDCAGFDTLVVSRRALHEAGLLSTKRIWLDLQRPVFGIRLELVYRRTEKQALPVPRNLRDRFAISHCRYRSIDGRLCRSATFRRKVDRQTLAGGPSSAR